MQTPRGKCLSKCHSGLSRVSRRVSAVPGFRAVVPGFPGFPATDNEKRMLCYAFFWVSCCIQNVRDPSPSCVDSETKSKPGDLLGGALL
jgi:hypothetical protein